MDKESMRKKWLLELGEILTRGSSLVKILEDSSLVTLTFKDKDDFEDNLLEALKTILDNSMGILHVYKPNFLSRSELRDAIDAKAKEDVQLDARKQQP